jgi:outer membrane protein
MPRSFRIRPILSLTAAILTIGGMLAPVVPLHAQESRTLTLDDAIRIAMERSIDLKRAANNIALGETSLRQERAGYLPNLSLSISPSERFGRAFDQTSGSVVDRRTEALSIGASSNITLFNGFATRASVAQAQAELNASQSTLERARQTLIFDVVQGYLQAVLDSALIVVEQDNLAAERTVLDRVAAYTQAGKRAASDLYAEQATVAQAELRLLNAQHAYELDKARLVQLLQLDPTGNYTFISPSVDTTAAGIRGYNYQEILGNMIDGRADIAAQRARVAAAEEGIKASRAGYWPTVSLSANAGTSFSSQNENSGFSDQLFNNNPNASLGLSITLPIFDRRQTESAVERAQIARDNELLTLQQLEQQIALDLRAAVLDYETASKQLVVADRQLTAAAEALRGQEERYRVGVSTLVELSQARAVYLQARSNRIQALYTLHLRERAIDYYRGTIAVPGR